MRDCIPYEELGTFDALPPDHPMRRHAESCTRCQAVLLAWHEFSVADPLPGSDVRDADARLDAFISRNVDPRGEPVPRPTTPARRFSFAMPRLAWGVVAAAAVALVVIQLRSTPDEGIVFRGGSGQQVVRVEAHATAAGLEVSWQPLDGADAYKVSTLDTDLAVIATSAPIEQTSLVLEVPGEGAFVQVTALHQGDTIAESQPVPVVR